MSVQANAYFEKQTRYIVVYFFIRYKLLIAEWVTVLYNIY